MNVFIEKYLLPICAAATVLLGFTNPMGWGIKERVVGGLLILFLALVLSRMVHSSNHSSARADSLTDARPARIVLPPEVTPEVMIRPFKDHTTLQAETLTNQYRGKWLHFAGEVRDVTDESMLREQRTKLIFRVPVANDDLCIVQAYFEGEWPEEVSLTRRGQRVSLLGEVFDVTESGLSLVHCELIRGS